MCLLRAGSPAVRTSSKRESAREKQAKAYISNIEPNTATKGVCLHIACSRTSDGLADVSPPLGADIVHSRLCPGMPGAQCIVTDLSTKCPTHYSRPCRPPVKRHPWLLLASASELYIGSMVGWSQMPVGSAAANSSQHEQDWSAVTNHGGCVTKFQRE